MSEYSLKNLVLSQEPLANPLPCRSPLLTTNLKEERGMDGCPQRPIRRAAVLRRGWLTANVPDLVGPWRILIGPPFDLLPETPGLNTSRPWNSL